MPFNLPTSNPRVNSATAKEMNCDRGLPHCWHISTKPILMVLPDGHLPVVCCVCRKTKTMHKDHIPRD